MKKILFLFIILLFTLTSCKNDKDGSVITKTDSSKEEFKKSYDKTTYYLYQSYPFVLNEVPRNLDLPVEYKLEIVCGDPYRRNSFCVSYYVYDEDLGLCENAIKNNEHYSYYVSFSCSSFARILTYADFLEWRYQKNDDSSSEFKYEFVKNYSDTKSSDYYEILCRDSSPSILYELIFYTDLNISEEYALNFENKYLSDF